MGKRGEEVVDVSLLDCLAAAFVVAVVAAGDAGGNGTSTSLRTMAAKMLERGQPWFRPSDMLMVRHDPSSHRRFMLAASS